MPQSAYFTISFEIIEAQHTHSKGWKDGDRIHLKNRSRKQWQTYWKCTPHPGIWSVSHEAAVVSQRLCKQHNNERDGQIICTCRRLCVDR